MDDLAEIEKREKISIFKFTPYIVGISILVVFIYIFLITPARKEDSIIHISPNDSLVKISNELKSENIINNSFLFKSLVSIFSGDKSISSGDYLFKKNANLLSVSLQISTGKHNVSPIRVTLKEGITNDGIANLLIEKIPNINKDLFLNDERSKQGYLFPDTYFFFPLSTTDEIINTISSNFKKRIASLDKEIESSKKSLSDIIIMASIIEKEASGKDDAAIISGILWKRISLGMSLQVDAAPSTYKEVGLPNAPISNPGLVSIRASVLPEESPYLFYLHDNDGQVHLAKDYKEHRGNITKYLK